MVRWINVVFASWLTKYMHFGEMIFASKSSSPQQLNLKYQVFPSGQSFLGAGASFLNINQSNYVYVKEEDCFKKVKFQKSKTLSLKL